MGTNYYSVLRDFAESEGFDGKSFYELIDGEEVLHIGKSSGGWCFGMHVMPERGINSLLDWIVVFIDPKRIVLNEYHEKVSLEEIMRIITARSWGERAHWSEEQLFKNGAEPGPNNLVRHRIDGRHCVGHGEGTWDYILGNFS